MRIEDVADKHDLGTIYNYAIESIESSTTRRYLTNNKTEFSLRDIVTIILNSSNNLHIKQSLLLSIYSLLIKNINSSNDELDCDDAELLRYLKELIEEIKYIIQIAECNDNHQYIYASSHIGNMMCTLNINKLLHQDFDTITVFDAEEASIILELKLNKRQEVSLYESLSNCMVYFSKYVEIPNDFDIGDTVIDIDNDDKKEFIVVGISNTIKENFDDCNLIVVRKEYIPINSDNKDEIKEYINNTYRERIKNFFRNNNDNCGDELSKNMFYMHVTKAERVQV